MKRALIIVAHPLAGSLCQRLAGHAAAQARTAGWQVTVRDLYARGFDPRLSAGERASYYKGFQGEAATEMAELSETHVLILVFPTWWFGFPAVLKGWFDRVWAPDLAYDHSPGFGPMIPRLTGLREVLVLTTMGAPAWVDWLAMRRPLRRVLRWGIVRPCAPQARVAWRSLYRAEAVDAARLARFEARVSRDLQAIARRLA